MTSFSKVLIIVENLPVPFDRRVWMEATSLQKAGYQVNTISPKGNGFYKDYEVIEIYS
ncbi:MAG: glycosyltransferase WbuB, partial [Moorea sp. SIO3E2]|nr:glycosyltransferase WbuB [Moorena sp. SIO3E2]